MMGDMADSGRLPGAMKLASEGWGVTNVFLNTHREESTDMAMC
jgi:hypothetical protein